MLLLKRAVHLRGMRVGNHAQFVLRISLLTWNLTRATSITPFLQVFGPDAFIVREPGEYSTCYRQGLFVRGRKRRLSISIYSSSCWKSCHQGY